MATEGEAQMSLARRPIHTFSGMRLLATMKAPAWVAATTLRDTTSLKAGSAAVYSDGHTDSAALCSALRIPTSSFRAATHLQEQTIEMLGSVF